METPTLTDIKTRLKYDYDIFDTDFIDLDTELLGLVNSAIDDCEALIHSLYEDYFLTFSNISMVASTQNYTLPSDIWANKIRVMYYDYTDKKYEIKRIRNLKNVMNFTNNSNSQDNYRYVLYNPTAGSGARIRFYPLPYDTHSDRIYLWYIRNAKKLSSASDTCDIPEFMNFIYAHVGWSVSKKEKARVNLEIAEKEFLFQRGLLEKALTDMVTDDDSTLIEKDTSFYEDFDNGTGE